MHGLEKRPTSFAAASAAVSYGGHGHGGRGLSGLKGRKFVVMLMGEQKSGTSAT